MWPGVNFVNVLQEAFAHKDPESAKKTDNLTVIVSVSGSVRAKAAVDIDTRAQSYKTFRRLTPLTWLNKRLNV